MKEDFWLSFWLKAIVVAQVAVVLIAIAATIWWLPQKWQVCQKLYDNKPAQILCLLDS
jgi:membrane protein YdbS with pleckstrin-like domain